MESTDQYNFSIFSPRNHHGKKNRNVILSMLLIWAVAVFGFQFLLRAIEKPTPEKTLLEFESRWPSVQSGGLSEADYEVLLNSLTLVKGKGLIKAEDQLILSEAISCIAFKIFPDSISALVNKGISDLHAMKGAIPQAEDQEYLDLRVKIKEQSSMITNISAPYSGFSPESLKASIFVASLVDEYPESLNDSVYSRLPEIMKLYLTHNQSVLTDTKFLGFPFHYFYTAVFLLILFISLCIIYNILIERRLKIDGVDD